MKAERIAQLEKLFSPDCERCDLCNSTTHVCILGKGNVLAPIMLIGEAPGAAEEESGKPFMGKSGKLLDQLLHALDISEQVYITNPVHCRPPGNRKPARSEIKACRFYLDEELNIVKPKVVVLMGRTAIESYGFGKDVTAGTKLFKFNETWVVPTWHPSYCLRRGKGAVKDLYKALRNARERSQ